MIILGVNSYHADAAAALVVDGQLIVAAEEERFCRGDPGMRTLSAEVRRRFV